MKQLEQLAAVIPATAKMNPIVGNKGNQLRGEKGRRGFYIMCML